VESQTKNCQNCKASFEIEAEDFGFYAKIKVPPPTWCPQCRLQRRAIWRNERSFHKRKCDAPGHDEIILSTYGSKNYKIYDSEYWWSDAWDPFDFQKEYDFTKTFFQQFNELLKAVPHNNFFSTNNVNSTYANGLVNSKNCYLVSSGTNCDNVLFSSGKVHNSKDSMDMGSFACNSRINMRTLFVQLIARVIL